MPVQLKDYVAAFLNAKRAAGRATSTLTFYAQMLGQFARHCAHWPPTVEDVEAFLLYKRQTVSETSVFTAWRAISAWLNWCERRGHLAENPLQYVDKPRRPQRLPKATTPKTLARLFATLLARATGGDAQAVRDHAMFRVAYDCGLRATELGGLRVDDLELAYHTLMVRNGKGGKDRSVYFGAKCARALGTWLEVHPGGDWLFPSRLRVELRPLTRRGVYHALKKWCRIADIELTPHQIRHSYATHALRRGIDLGHVSRQLGHSSITTTAIYLAADDPARRMAHLEHAPGDDV